MPLSRHIQTKRAQLPGAKLDTEQILGYLNKAMVIYFNLTSTTCIRWVQKNRSRCCILINKSTENILKEKQSLEAYAYNFSSDVKVIAIGYLLLFNILNIRPLPYATRNDGIIDQHAQ